MSDHAAASLPLLIAGAALFVFLAYCWARICAKAGFPAWWGLLLMVPIINLIPFLYLAFGPWPVHRHGR